MGKEIKPQKTMKVEIEKCCAICDNLYNKEKCPLCQVYSTATDCGCDVFDEDAKYLIVCKKFVLHKKYL